MSDPPFDIRKHVQKTLARNYYACQDRESARERVYREALERITNADPSADAEDLILTALDALIDGEGFE